MSIAAYENRCEAQYQAGLARAEAIRDRVDDLLNSDYDPLDPDNISEMLGFADNLEKMYTQISLGLREGDHAFVGRLIELESFQYWEAKAYERAEDDVTGGRE